MFKDIKGFEGLYAIYNDGRVYSYKTGKFLKPYKHKGGYLIVSLQTNGIKKRYYVHKLVAEYFIPNPDNLPQVNHKDGDKDNCHDWNLEWCTQPYNIKHAFDNGLNKYSPKGKKVAIKKV